MLVLNGGKRVMGGTRTTFERKFWVPSRLGYRYDTFGSTWRYGPFRVSVHPSLM